MPEIPLSVLDLVPIAAGSEAATAVRHTIELARHAERLGYHRSWLRRSGLRPDGRQWRSALRARRFPRNCAACTSTMMVSTASQVTAQLNRW